MLKFAVCAILLAFVFVFANTESETPYSRGYNGINETCRVRINFKNETKKKKFCACYCNTKTLPNGIKVFGKECIKYGTRSRRYSNCIRCRRGCVLRFGIGGVG